jgi:hypothetical protein
MVSVDQGKNEAVEKILHSQVFRSSESLRRLLRFLADKTIAGEADQLKEYSVGLDAFGKPADYDPRQDSAVRIQVGRLRQKLSEYYLTEGKEDPVVVELPKGGFKLHFETRPEAAPRVATTVVQPPEPVAPVQKPSKFSTWVLVAALAVVTVWAVGATVAWNTERALSATVRAAWNSDMETLWAPFLEDSRPLILAVSSPLFVGIRGFAYWRDVNLNRFEDAPKDPHLKPVLKALGDPEIFPHLNYTGTGDANALFEVGKLLATRKSNISFAKSSDLSWQQFASNNVILLGTPRSFGTLLDGLPADFQLTLDRTGLRVMNPRNGEQAIYPDQTNQGQRLAMAPEDGEVYAIITRTPGPNGNGTVAAFTSNLNVGTVAGVEWFTEPSLATSILQKIRDKDGNVPRYLQIALRVRFKGNVPTETTYLLHRVLKSTAVENSGK